MYFLILFYRIFNISTISRLIDSAALFALQVFLIKKKIALSVRKQALVVSPNFHKREYEHETIFGIGLRSCQSRFEYARNICARRVCIDDAANLFSRHHGQG